MADFIIIGGFPFLLVKSLNFPFFSHMHVAAGLLDYIMTLNKNQFLEALKIQIF